MMVTKNFELRMVQIDMSVVARMAPLRSLGTKISQKRWANVAVQPTHNSWRDILTYHEAFRYFYSSLNFKLKFSVVAEGIIYQ